MQHYPVYVSLCYSLTGTANTANSQIHLPYDFAMSVTMAYRRGTKTGGSALLMDTQIPGNIASIVVMIGTAML